MAGRGGPHRDHLPAHRAHGDDCAWLRGAAWRRRHARSDGADDEPAVPGGARASAAGARGARLAGADGAVQRAAARLGGRTQAADVRGDTRRGGARAGEAAAVSRLPAILTALAMLLAACGGGSSASSASVAARPIVISDTNTPPSRSAFPSKPAV